MKFKDVIYSKEHRFSIGIEEESGKYYLSFPVFNGTVEYEEYFEISKLEFLDFNSDLNRALTLLNGCKQRKEEARLFYQPSIKRGSPC